ncbi:hypothetical protein [Carnobacterium sp. TMP28]|uniref:hypothetical protein n=1 Tax=Carnobacterium sp. TMP28 TaxID=3397060 RepID=UPI0039E1C749
MKTTLEALLNVIYEETPGNILNSDVFEEKIHVLLKVLSETNDGYFLIDNSALQVLVLDESSEERILNKIKEYQGDIESGQMERDSFDLYVSYR